ncbi:hypothetical protein Prudu_8S000300 [Prunus dulcis]|uniref:DUF4218 domain-containing protein n=1 Tax=Prunus dulcis TaxID=3755 RepID=A0A5H2XIM1_PRUDU|nr:hypothetical protein Prudu_8S000300 [Prunus dulcis]
MLRTTYTLMELTKAIRFGYGTENLENGLLMLVEMWKKMSKAGMDDNDLGDIGFDPYEFANVIGDRDQPLYPGSSKYTMLSALVKLYNLKAKHGMSDVCFTELLILQGDLLSKINTLPSSMYEAKKILSALGMSYEEIHACPNDCILYRKDYEDSTNCPTCGVSRWKEGKDAILKEGVPSNVVWYFPPIPRFKRMFQSHKTAKNLTWHAARKSVDGHMSHPADSPSWKLVDDKWPEFVTYNLPSWLCMKRKFMMLTLLISGPKQPGNDIDVYLEPLIDDLKSLWDGIRGVYDAHIGEYFTLRGRATFNGKPEYGTPPEPLNREEVLRIVEDINYIWGSKNRGSVGENDGDRVCWKKKSKSFDLEYWKYLHVRHVLDVMHIEKNVCDSIIGTLLEIPEKIKMGLLLDLRLLGLKSHDCHTLMQQLLPMTIRSALEKPARYMKVLKGYVQNRARPEGCIAERYIAEEAVEFCTEHLSDVSTVEVPSSQKMGVSKPLSSCTVSLVDRDWLNQAHLYVLENTEEVLPYIEEHMIHIKTTYPKFRKRTKWLQDKHNSTFIQWLHFKHNGVSENLRWLAAGPSMAVPSYRSYLINGVKFNTKAQDDVRIVQNSGVYLLAHTMQVASAKDKNPIVSNIGFYGVIQEIWDLDYHKFRIPVLRCDWVDNTSGLVVTYTVIKEIEGDQ